MPRFAIVDSEVLIAAHDGELLPAEILAEAFFYLRMGAYIPSITPTVGHELIDGVEHEADPAIVSVLSEINAQIGHGAIYYPTLNPMGAKSDSEGVINGHAGMAAEELFEKGLVHDKNIALIIAEAACIPAEIVIFSEDVANSLDNKAINKVLVIRDLSAVKITHPMGVIEMFSRKP